MLFRQLIDPETSTFTYLLADPVTHEAVLIDPVLEQVERDLRILKELGLTLRYLVETHVHADHTRAPHYSKKKRVHKPSLAKAPVSLSLTSP